MDLEALIEQVAQRLGLAPVDVLHAGRLRTVARARAIICVLAVECADISGREASRRLNLSPSAVSKLVHRRRRVPLTETLTAALLRKN